MVSTRGIKFKFSENERVLCYEPDPTKAKVLYDSKVLDIVINKDHRGRKSVEYLIHFQGWNSSWDRCVGEEYVLKDTPENRQLQKDLAEKSQLQLGAYLYRRERKKHSGKTGDRVPHSSDDGSSGSPTRMDTDDGGHEVTSSSDYDSSVDEEVVRIEIPSELKEILEMDYDLIVIKDKVVKLPSEPNVITILENYYKQYATQQVSELNESKPKSRFPCNNSNAKRRQEDIQKNLNLCKEVLDGIRIYFEFTLHDLLLYKEEVGQVETLPALMRPLSDYDHKQSLLHKHDEDRADGGANLGNTAKDKALARKRTLRSNKSTDCLSNGNYNNEAHTTTKPVPSQCGGKMNKYVVWKILPDNVYAQHPLPTSLIYGATHLLRLFVKLPELLNAANVDDMKLKIVLEHVDLFLQYLNEHREWFDEKNYVEK